MVSRALVVAVVALLLSCAASNATAIGAPDPVSAVVLASAVGVARRTQGDCFTVCPVGTACNVKTGYCDTLPCHGQCQDRERCDESGLIPHCVPDGSEVFIAGGGDGGVG